MSFKNIALSFIVILFLGFMLLFMSTSDPKGFMTNNLPESVLDFRNNIATTIGLPVVQTTTPNTVLNTTPVNNLTDNFNDPINSEPILQDDYSYSNQDSTGITNTYSEPTNVYDQADSEPIYSQGLESPGGTIENYIQNPAPLSDVEQVTSMTSKICSTINSKTSINNQYDPYSDHEIQSVLNNTSLTLNAFELSSLSVRIIYLNPHTSCEFTCNPSSSNAVVTVSGNSCN